MKLMVTGMGISTARISSVEALSDTLCDINLYQKYKVRSYKSPVESALKEAGAVGIPIIIAGEYGEAFEASVKVNTLEAAIAEADKFEESAILCVQRGEEDQPDAVVIRLRKGEAAYAYAVIAGMEKASVEDGHEPAFEQLYRQKGPVCEAGNLLCGCIALYYNFKYPLETASEYMFDYEKWEDYELVIPINDKSGILLQKADSPNVMPRMSEYSLIPVRFSTEEDIKEKLALLAGRMDHISVQEIAAEQLKQLHISKVPGRTVVFIAKDGQDLQKEINMFLEQKEHWFTKGFQWSTLNGSCYTAAPLGNDTQICFMNPPGGMFMKVPFYRLYRLMPELEKSVRQMTMNLATDDDLIKRYSFEILTTRIILDALELLGVKADVMLGGSMGELSLSLALGCITVDLNNRGITVNSVQEGVDLIINVLDEVLKSQNDFSLEYFKSDIGVMEKWYLKCDVDRVREAIALEGENPRVFMTIIGSPRDVIITGNREACARVIGKLKCFSSQFNDPIYAHTPVMEYSREKIQGIVTDIGIHLKKDLPYAIYSTNLKKQMDTTVEMYAANFADCIIKQVDMPGVFELAYQRGCRIFIDLGTNSLCSQWAKETFKDRDDVLITSLFEEGRCRDGLLLFLAQMMTNQIELDMDKIIDRYQWVEAKEEARSENALEMLQPAAVPDALEHARGLHPEVIKGMIAQQIKNNHRAYESYMNFQRALVSWYVDDNLSSTAAVKEETASNAGKCLYDYEDVLEMTNGSMAKVLGPLYEAVDKYPIRARMPSPPFMFITRILSINAEFGEFKPGSSIEAEYDVREDCILRTSREGVSALVFGEASHIGIFLAGYMGIDAVSNGTAKFRVTDTDTTYQESRYPIIGETARVIFTIERFVKNGDITLLFCSYKVYLGDVLTIAAKEIGGFFTQKVLDNGMGIREELKTYEGPTLPSPYAPVSSRKYFDKEEVHAYLQGDPVKCFGVPCVNCVTSYQVKEDIEFLDRIVDISGTGGAYGLGYIIGEKDIDETFWPFKCHFKNDPILPGTIMLEGITQVSIFFQIYQGLFNTSKAVNARFEPNHTVKNTFRGEVRPGKHTLRFRIDPREVRSTKEGIRFAHDSSVYCDGLQVIQQKNAVVLIYEVD